jgi:hypothetical protein
MLILMIYISYNYAFFFATVKIGLNMALEHTRSLSNTPDSQTLLNWQGVSSRGPLDLS